MDGEHRAVVVEGAEFPHGVGPEGESAEVHADVDGEVVVGVLRRVDAAENASEQAEIGDVLMRDLADIEAEAGVGDAVGVHGMEDGLHAADSPLLVEEGDGVLQNVGPLQGRDAVLLLLGGLVGLVFPEQLRFLDDLVHFFRREGGFVGRELFSQLLVLLVHQSRFGQEGEQDGVVGFEDHALHKVFVIARADPLFELGVVVEDVHVGECSLFVVKP